MPGAISVSPMWRERWRKGSSPEMKILLALFLTGPLLAQSAEQTEFFEKKIRPIFATKCAACHGGEKPRAGIDFSSSAVVNEVVVEGDAAGSRLYQAVSYSGPVKMPPQ